MCIEEKSEFEIKLSQENRPTKCISFRVCLVLEIISIPLHSKRRNYIQHNMVRQCFILFGCLALGELLVWLTGVKLPASIIGMLILTLLLKLKVVKLEWVRGLTDFLIANLGFFFVPPGVALMLYFDLIRAEMIPIALATLLSTIIVLIITGHTHQAVSRGENKVREKIHGKKHE